jgi:microcystin degradation protein MlrC
MTRVAIAGIVHETNTYCQTTTDAAQFRVLRGEKFFRLRGTETTIGGAIDECERRGFEVVPIMVANAQPSGTIEEAVYEDFKQEILETLVGQMPVDGVLLDLHGAGVTTHLDDLEGDLCRAIRKLVGEAVPIAAVFDLHGNITQDMADSLDGTFACRQYPHVDLHLRAAEGIALIADMLEQGFRPVSHVESLPILLPTTTTFGGIGDAYLQEVLAAEQADPAIIDISWFHGFPYTDIPHVGCTLVVTYRGERSKAEQIARQLANRLWQLREQFVPERLDADQAVARALKQPGFPVVINETSDNCGGGSPGDGTHLLRAMLAANLENSCFGFLVDPEVAQQASQTGVGSVIDVELGGKTDDLHGAPLRLTAYVRALHDGRLILQAMAKGAPINLGTMVRLVVDGIDIIVVSKRSQTLDPGPFEALGIDIRTKRIVALKSSNHFRAGFKDIAAAIVTADTPGLTTNDISVFPRRKQSQPLWPIDAEANYTS